MKRKNETSVATQEEMEKAVAAMLLVLDYVDSQMEALKLERKDAIDTCVGAGVPKPVVAELLRRRGMDDDTKNVIDVYVPLLEAYLESTVN